MNVNSSPKINDHDQHHQAFNHQLVSSSSSSHFSFASTQDRAGFYHRQYSYQPHHLQDESYTYQGGSTYEIKNKVESSLKLGLWKKEDQGPAGSILEEDNDQVKWLSSKMRMKNHDQKLQRTSSSFQTHNYISSTPIRVCSDCHTTKTPLWRSGPKGPKSLCNACGIRQRKARRAMAAAAAAGGGGTVVASDQPPPVKMYKAKMAKNTHSSKRCKMAGEPSESGGKNKVNFEDFLINLSNKLAFHRVFPQDEKDAAILLMAISSGLVHG